MTVADTNKPKTIMAETKFETANDKKGNERKNVE